MRKTRFRQPMLGNGNGRNQPPISRFGARLAALDLVTFKADPHLEQFLGNLFCLDVGPDEPTPYSLIILPRVWGEITLVEPMQ